MNLPYIKAAVAILITALFLAGCRPSQPAPTESAQPKTATNQTDQVKNSPVPQVSIHLDQYPKNIAAADLDGDGRTEKILLSCPNPEADEYTLCIDSLSVHDTGSNIDGVYYLVDIDKNDKYRELVVSESGPSDDYKNTFYAYNGKGIVKLGKLQGWPEAVYFDQHGIVKACTRGQTLQTWYYPDPYKLFKHSRLERIPQDLYPVNTEISVIKTITLQKSRTDEGEAYTLQVGDKATILSSDDREWCSVKNSEGEIGWFAFDNIDIIRGTGERACEYFAGLCYAD